MIKTSDFSTLCIVFMNLFQCCSHFCCAFTSSSLHFTVCWILFRNFCNKLQFLRTVKYWFPFVFQDLNPMYISIKFQCLYKNVNLLKYFTKQKIKLVSKTIKKASVCIYLKLPCIEQVVMEQIFSLAVGLLDQQVDVTIISSITLLSGVLSFSLQCTKFFVFFGRPFFSLRDCYTCQKLWTVKFLDTIQNILFTYFLDLSILSAIVLGLYMLILSVVLLT
eukprot:TRINITY_DN1349_c1_g1_i1.p1 TRINITY_DN1349_c1_g1~~TRINITY_DN1349_c1_g1_i1.p1  ORF type:complete len:220 (+),score=-14.59 TRINITY_DN1349_c1_g1_i1:541-1200(+)